MTTQNPMSYMAFALLLLIAAAMGGNHVAARIAFDQGLDVATAVVFRSAITAAVVGSLWLATRPSSSGIATLRRPWTLPLLGLLIGLQSLCLYASVIRLPVALALLVFNTHPLWTAFWARVLYGERPSRRLLQAMPVLLLGLALALDVAGAASGLGMGAQWARMGAGVAFALAAALLFGLALAITQHEVAGLDARLRTAVTLGGAAVVGVLAVAWQGGPALPAGTVGWTALAVLVVLYGASFALLFSVLPKLGVVGNSAVLSTEPVFALVLAWAILGQSIAGIQLVGAALVVGTITWISRPGGKRR